MAKRILVIVGHPDARRLSSQLAESYAAAATHHGADVQTLSLSDLTFDPVLRKGYAEPQPIEPDLQRAQRAIVWADHVVWVFPVWWGSLPALLKGFIDRVFIPGFAFRYRGGGSSWDRLLAGRSSRVISTMDTPVWYDRLMYGNPLARQLKRPVLGFVGFDPVRMHAFGPVKGASAQQHEKWRREVLCMAAQDAA